MCPVLSKFNKYFPKSKIFQYFLSRTECDPKKCHSFSIKLQNPFETWKLKKLIGFGAFGKIYQVKDIHNGKQAAMKIVVVDKDFDVDKLIIEIEIMKKCRHKNIVNFYDSFIYDSKIYIIMEFCNFGSLDSIMCKLDRNFTEDEIRFIIKQILEALVYLHGTVYVIHRDIKAANILLCKNGQAKLTDFGVSAKNWYLEQKKTTFTGSPHWISPEIVSCKEEIFKTYNYKVDIWSLGITCIELAEKLPPNNLLRPKDAIKKIYVDNSPSFQEPDKWSIEFIDFVSRCLTKSPEKRPNASELLEHPFIKTDMPVFSNIHRNERIFELVKSSCFLDNFNNEQDIDYLQDIDKLLNSKSKELPKIPS